MGGAPRRLDFGSLRLCGSYLLMILMAWWGSVSEKNRRRRANTDDAFVCFGVVSKHDFAMHALAKGRKKLILVDVGMRVNILGLANCVCFHDVMCHRSWERALKRGSISRNDDDDDF